MCGRNLGTNILFWPVHLVAVEEGVARAREDAVVRLEGRGVVLPVRSPGHGEPAVLQPEAPGRRLHGVGELVELLAHHLAQGRRKRKGSEKKERERWSKGGKQTRQNANERGSGESAVAGSGCFQQCRGAV